MATDVRTRVRSNYEILWNAGDLSAVDDGWHDGFIDHWHGQTGKEAWKSTVSELRRTFPDLHFDVILQVAEQDRVVTYWKMRGTDRGGLFRLAPTGKSAEFTGVFIDRLDDDRIAEHWAVSDTWRVMRQLEVVPSSWAADAPLAAASGTQKRTDHGHQEGR
jgi:predicted ester cyclase